MLRIFAFGSCPPIGVTGDLEKADDVALEKDGRGIGCVGVGRIPITLCRKAVVFKAWVGEAVLDVSSKGRWLFCLQTEDLVWRRKKQSSWGMRAYTPRS